MDVINTNDAPVVENEIDDQMGEEGAAFEFVLSGNIFADVDAGDTLVLTATLSDDSDLPVWLAFDGSKFSGKPDEEATYEIKVIATDDSMATTNNVFTLTIDPLVGVNILTAGEVIVYPNPLAGKFMIKRSNEDMVDFLVTDCSGKQVVERKQIGNLLQIDLSSQPKGIYFLHLKSSKINYKIIKLVTK